MRILHTYCLNYNLGDLALGIGVKNILRRYFPVDLIGETNLQGTVFDEVFIDRMNKNYDLLVIGGGGIIHGAHWPNGWFWLINQADIRRIKIPFMVYGAGYNYFRGEQGIPEVGKPHLMETQQKAIFFSVRNDGSRERLLEDAGINAVEIADPGFWSGWQVTASRPISEDYVLIQLADDKSNFRFGSNKTRRGFVQAMRHVTDALSKRYRVVLAPHVFADVPLCQEVATGFNGVEVLDFGRFAFDHVIDFLAYYKHAHFVLGMRGHAQILPHGMEVPLISLENHDKHVGLMRKLSLEQYNVPVAATDFPDRLMEVVLKLEKDCPDLKTRLKEQNTAMLESTAALLNSVVQRLHG